MAGYHEVAYDDGDQYRGEWSADGKVCTMDPELISSEMDMECSHLLMGLATRADLSTGCAPAMV